MKKAEASGQRSGIRDQRLEANDTHHAPGPNRQSPIANRKSQIPWWLLAVLLALGTLALYWPAIRCDFIVIDDAFNVTANVPVQKGLTWEGIKLFFFNPWAPPGWTPMTMLSHMMVSQVCGMKPWGHHLGNVLVHALNAALVFAWLRQMTGATWRSLAVAALFAVHPLRVEPVLWVTERREVLCASFGLLTLMAYVRYAKAKAEGSPKSEVRSPKGEGILPNPATSTTHHAPRNTFHVSRFMSPASRFYLLSVAFYACGVLSKPTIVTWPFVMLLLDYWPLGRMHIANGQLPIANWKSAIGNWKSQILLPLLVEKLPFFFWAVFLSAMAAVGHELSHGFTWGGNQPLGARLGNAVVSYGWYLGKLFWPADLAVFYPHPGYWPLGMVVLASGLILGISVLVAAGWRRHPYLLVGWLWYCGTLVPNSQVLQSGVLPRADRWTYVPLLGFLILIVWGAWELMPGKAESRKQKAETPNTQHAIGNTHHAPLTRFQSQIANRKSQILLGAVGVAIVLCMALTRRQIGYWKDSETLLRHSLAVTKSNEVPLTFLGTALGEKGQIDEAIRQYQAAIRLNPDFAPARNELGVALSHKGQIDAAITHFQEATRIEPGYTLAYFNLGNAFLEKGQTDEAIHAYREALRRQLRLSLGDPSLHNNLGLALARKGQTDEAITQYLEALRLQPDDPDIHFNLGAALAQRGQMDEAIRHYQEALRLKPDQAQAHNNLGAAFYQQGRADEAIGQFQEALRLKPDYAEARKNLIVALAAKANPSLPPGASTNR